MIDKIKKLYPIVEDILRNFPDARDNDNLLILKVWAVQNPTLRGDVKFTIFAREFIDGSYAPVESITRARRKVQEEHTDLRGDRYHKRSENEQSVRKNINN